MASLFNIKRKRQSLIHLTLQFLADFSINFISMPSFTTTLTDHPSNSSLTVRRPPVLAIQKSASSGGLSSRYKSSSNAPGSASLSPGQQPLATSSASAYRSLGPGEWIEMQEVPLERCSTTTGTMRSDSGREPIRVEEDELTMVVGRGPEGDGMWERVVRRWKRYVSVSVDIRASRDHLAVERTFLAYLRTSSIGAVTGTTISQLFVLDNPPLGSDSDTTAPVPGFSFQSVGQPLATVCYCYAILSLCVGAYRVWRLQEALLYGKGLAGGPEPTSLFVFALLLILTFLGLTLALDVLVL